MLSYDMRCYDVRRCDTIPYENENEDKDENEVFLMMTRMMLLAFETTAA
jgi:hypothetical protein